MTSSPQLAPPGAGLPNMELITLKIIFGLLTKITSRTRAEKLFSDEKIKIDHLLLSTSSVEQQKQVLIPRLKGLEDSSRYWSIWMTLDHLCLVHNTFLKVITMLAEEKKPDFVASTADVKPSAEVEEKIVKKFQQSCEHFQSTCAAIPNLKTTTRFLHPWFGHLNAAEWHYLAGFHLRLHRQQIEFILQAQRRPT